MENQIHTRPGEYLRAERERRNISIEQIASATKINIKLLHALEADSYDSLPAKPFVRGFVTNYARYIGLDPQEVLSRFETFLDENTGLKFKRPADAPHIFVDRDGSSENSKTILAIIMGLFLVVGFVVVVVLKPSIKHGKHANKQAKLSQISNEEMYVVPLPPNADNTIEAKKSEPVKTETKPNPAVELKPEAKSKPEPKQEPKPEHKAETKSEKKDKTTEKKSEKPAEEDSDSEDTANADQVAKPQPTPSSAAVKPPSIPASEVKHRLVVRAKEDSWIKYQSDDRSQMGYILRKDKVIYVKARQNIRFMTGNPKGIEFSYNNGPFQTFKDTTRSLVLPKEAEAEFQGKLFSP